MQQIWITAAGLSAATLLGALLGFAFKELPHKWNDGVLGFCAGIMLAASTIGLIVPAAEQAGGAWWLVLAGVVLGMLFLNVLDKVTPHLHRITGLDREEHLHNASLNRILLFVLAIALHKFPEGIASGVGFNSEDVSDAWTVAAGIALQNIPEGMVVIAPLLLAGVSKMRTLLISLAIAMLEVAGVWTGYALGAISMKMLPLMLDAAADAFVCRRRDALCGQRRDDSRNARPRLREDCHLVPRARLRGTGAVGEYFITENVKNSTKSIA